MPPPPLAPHSQLMHALSTNCVVRYDPPPCPTYIYLFIYLFIYLSIDISMYLYLSFFLHLTTDRQTNRVSCRGASLLKPYIPYM